VRSRWAGGSPRPRVPASPRLALTILALLLLAGLLAAPTAAAADDQLDPQIREIARLLRCPVCQSLSVADSPSELAGDMRALIRKQLVAGQSREQVIAYFVDRYGDEVLLDPPKAGFSQLIWWGAAGIPLAGAAIVFLFVRGRVRTARRPEPAERSLPGSERQKYELLLEQELERVGGGERW
jgi:cytochrome c-type biogenesis protein CcmH